MRPSHSSAAALTAIGLAGRLARAVLPAPLIRLRDGIVRRAAPRLARRLSDRLQSVLDRTPDLIGTTFVIDPLDLPERFAISLAGDEILLDVLAPGDDLPADAAVIRGALLRLVDLVEGRQDGDALFFSRDLAFEGRTEAIVALRNTLENAELDLMADIAALFGPFAPLARRGLRRGRARLERADAALAELIAAIRAPLERRIARQAKKIQSLETDTGPRDTRHSASMQELAA